VLIGGPPPPIIGEVCGIPARHRDDPPVRSTAWFVAVEPVDPPPPTADEAPTPTVALGDPLQSGFDLADLMQLVAALLVLGTVLIGWNRSRRRA
jgi:hypothetical protein